MNKLDTETCSVYQQPCTHDLHTVSGQVLHTVSEQVFHTYQEMTPHAQDVLWVLGTIPQSAELMADPDKIVWSISFTSENWPAGPQYQSNCNSLLKFWLFGSEIIWHICSWMMEKFRGSYNLNTRHQRSWGFVFIHLYVFPEQPLTCYAPGSDPKMLGITVEFEETDRQTLSNLGDVLLLFQTQSSPWCTTTPLS